MTAIRWIACLGLVILLMPSRVLSEVTVVVRGQPIMRGTSRPDKSFNEQIGEDKIHRFRLMITAEKAADGLTVFRWESRDNRIMDYSVRGDFHYFFARDNTGYVKIAVGQDETVVYIEHLHEGFNTVNYWGQCNQFDLPSIE